jgi:hypothetical protein
MCVLLLNLVFYVCAEDRVLRRSVSAMASDAFSSFIYFKVTLYPNLYIGLPLKVFVLKNDNGLKRSSQKV